MLKHAKWTWGAMLTEIGIFLSPLMEADHALVWLGLLGAHAVASGIFALSCYVLLPARFKRPPAPALLLLFLFSFVVPVIGGIGILIITRYAMRRVKRQLRYAVPQIVDLPQYDVQGTEAVRRGQSSIRSRLGSDVPGDIRMQALLTLQAVPGRVANPILEDLLGDDVDDVRLLAFGMLDTEEKKISEHIQHERTRLAGDLDAEQRLSCLRHLAELHWELVYAGLAQGELRRHILGVARDYLEQALALAREPDPGMLFLRGRILLAQGHDDAARGAIEGAIARGLSPASALPYLAEIAYLGRHFDEVRQYMEQTARLHIAPKTRAIADLWTGRDTVSKLGERNILPHL